MKKSEAAKPERQPLVSVRWDAGENLGEQVLEVLGWSYDTETHSTEKYDADGNVVVRVVEVCTVRARLSGTPVERWVRRWGGDAPNRRKARKAALKKLLAELSAQSGGGLAMPREARRAVWQGVWKHGVRW